MARYWRTDDGDLVEEGHADARLLAYTDEDEVPSDEKIRGKKAAAPENKKSPAPKNKGK